jgi:cytochrome P450
MPEIWGEDCEDFKPERFLETDGNGKMKVVEVSQWKFHAFSELGEQEEWRFGRRAGSDVLHLSLLIHATSSDGGPRLCLGKLLATYEGMAVIAAILGR